ncbi:MAG: thiamine pyrophosphate-dependent dehydrogenase E1 component subunit alpha [Sphingopyxis sp.]
MSHQLGTLADPAEYNAPIALDNQPTQALLDALETMLRIRFAEESVAELAIAGEAKCPCHLGIGQEAVAVGISSKLRATDRVFGGHRSHSHYLALGASLDKMMAEILGKVTGASRGMGGSMHLFAPEVGFHGSVPIVGATIPIAAGAALAAKMDGRGDVAVGYFGDGACEEGVLHETLNMASVMKLPCLFVVENNLYSSHLDIGLRQPANSVARFAQANRIATRVVDGNDVVAVRRAAGELIDAARRGEGPGFLEAVTFRWRGHVGPNEDIDVGVQRAPEILAAWKKRDPVARLWQSLVADRGVDPAALPAMETAVRAQVAAAVDAARAAPYPQESALLDLVYAPRGESA